MLSALRIPGVRWIVGLYSADLLIEFASSVALMVLVYDATSSPLAAALMLFVKQVIPGAVLASAADRIERVDARSALALSYLVRAFAFGLLALIGSGNGLYVLALLAGAAGISSRILLRATVVRSTSGDGFRQVTAAQNVLFGVLALLGPALGALAAAAIGSIASLVGWAAMSLAVVAATLFMPESLRTRAVAPAEERAREPEVVAEPSGVHAPAWSLLVLGAVVVCAFAMDEPALLAYVRDGLGADVGAYGGILVAWGLGMIAGGVLYGRVGIAFPFRAIVGGIVATASGYIALGVAPSVGLAYVAAVLGGVGNGTYWVALVTAYLERASVGGAAAKASARLEGVATAMVALGIVAGGLVAEFAGPRITLWLPGVIVLVVLLLWVVGDRSARRRSERVFPVPRAADDSAAANPSAIAPSPSRAEVLA